MSLAIILDTFPRWSERFIARELNELKRRGLAFSIYCLKAGDSDCASDPDFADLIAQRVVLPACFIPSAARELGLDAEARVRREFVEAELGLTAFRQIGCANSLVKLLREHRHTHVYAHFASLPSTLGWLAAAALNLPLVISAHARDVFVEAQLLAEKLRYARRVFTCNSRALEALHEAELKATVEGKAVLMRHGLPLERYPFKARQPGAGDASFKILAAGRFVEKKGFGELIATLAPFLSSANASLTLIGEGPEHKALQKQIGASKLGEKVHLPGTVNGQALLDYFNSADVLAVPSRMTQNGDSDGLPNVVLEAFALGLPVMGTQAGSMGDALTPETGTVVAADGFDQAIRAMYADSQPGIDRAVAARQFIEAHYDIRKNIEPLVKELERIRV